MGVIAKLPPRNARNAEQRKRVFVQKISVAKHRCARLAVGVFLVEVGENGKQIAKSAPRRVVESERDELARGGNIRIVDI